MKSMSLNHSLSDFTAILTIYLIFSLNLQSEVTQKPQLLKK